MKLKQDVLSVLRKYSSVKGVSRYKERRQQEKLASKIVFKVFFGMKMYLSRRRM